MRKPLQPGDRVYWRKTKSDKGTVIVEDRRFFVRWDDGQIDNIDSENWTLDDYLCAIQGPHDCGDTCWGRRVGMVRRKRAIRKCPKCGHEVRIITGRLAIHDIDGLEPIGEGYFSGVNNEGAGHKLCFGSRGKP
ncbi:MAG: hypothetical protein WC869_08310 [Phycisphaerae bacterium]|jgi:hypothetical protein